MTLPSTTYEVYSEAHPSGGTESDLPIIPCYVDNNCGLNFNCGDSPNCGGNESLKICPTDSTEFESKCYGSNPEYCQGILSVCDSSFGSATNGSDDSSGLYCDEDSNDQQNRGAVNSNGENMGCNIEETAFPPDYQHLQGSFSPCMEFNNNNDKNIDISTPCWQSGGFDIVKNQCEQKIGNRKNECIAMGYFCEWDPTQSLCTLPSTRKNITPLQNYKNKYGTLPPKIYTKHYSDTDGIYVNSSQSAWDSKKQTSYDVHQRIDCVKNINNSEKICITTPRCQLVDSTCECGSRPLVALPQEESPPLGALPQEDSDLLFMCSKLEYNNVDTSGNIGNINAGIGYVTWCKGHQSNKEYVVPVDRYKTLISMDRGIIPITRDVIDWNTDNGSCNNRCTNYNECESNESEELWNKCIYDISGGKYGVDYNSDGYNKAMLRTEGFCIDVNSEDMNTYVSECEKKLENLGSINWGRVFSPGGLETAACEYRYNWNHTCIVSADNSKISENYLCTWCPSLQCKIGSKEEICSTIWEGSDSWNGFTQCDTDSGHGQMVASSKEIPNDCDCFLPKYNTLGSPVNNNIDDDKLQSQTEAVVIGGTTLGALISMVLIAVL